MKIPFLDKAGFDYLVSKIKTLLTGKADKSLTNISNSDFLNKGSSAGLAKSSHNHSLSDVSETTDKKIMTASERTKLSGIADGANKTIVDSALSDSSTNPVQNKVVNAALGGKANTTHEHNYAGSSSAGGAANSANKLNSDAGSATNPVYFANGVPVKTTYTLGSSVPTNAKFTDTVYTHPTYTAKSNGLYKVTVDSQGHVSGTAAVSKSDITALGIPAQDTVYTHPSYTARTGVPTANASPGFGGTFNVSQPVSDASGHITAMNSRTITIPKTEASTSEAGLMSPADKAKLNGIATGANAYTHPTYTAKSNGLYKVTVDSQGHVSGTAAVSKSDITALGIPAKTDVHSLTELGTRIPASDNLNNYKTPGNYYVAGASDAAAITNSPMKGSGFRLIVEAGYVSGYIRQYAIGVSGNIQTRYFQTSWSEWMKIINDYDLENDIFYHATEQLTNENLNTLLTPGFYYAAGSNTCTNSPAPENSGFGLEVVQSAGGYYTQICYIANAVHIRYYNGSTWSDWKQFYTEAHKPSLSSLGLTATATELNYMDGVTSAIQPQLNSKTSNVIDLALPSNVDMNNYKTPGEWFCGTWDIYNGTKNAPPNATAGIVRVTTGSVGFYIYQEWLAIDGKIFRRVGTNYGASWTNWAKVNTT